MVFGLDLIVNFVFVIVASHSSPSSPFALKEVALSSTTTYIPSHSSASNPFLLQTGHSPPSILVRSVPGSGGSTHRIAPHFLLHIAKSPILFSGIEINSSLTSYAFSIASSTVQPIDSASKTTNLC